MNASRLGLIFAAGAILILESACSGTKTDTTYRKVVTPTYPVVPNPNPRGGPTPLGTLAAFDAPDPADLKIVADSWNPGSTTALLSTTYVQDGDRTCLDLGFQIGFQWEAIECYLSDQGGLNVFNFSEAARINLDVRGDYADPDGYQSLTLALIMENGAWYSKSAAVTTDWQTATFTLPAPGSQLVDDGNGNKVFDGWIWSSWTTFDTFDVKDITQIFISASPAVGGPYHIRYDNLALLQ